MADKYITSIFESVKTQIYDFIFTVKSQIVDRLSHVNGKENRYKYRIYDPLPVKIYLQRGCLRRGGMNYV